jgi:hypothetical protein
VEEGEIGLKAYFLDGTKIEANAAYEDSDLEELGGNGPIPPEKLETTIGRITEKGEARLEKYQMRPGIKEGQKEMLVD